MEKVWWLSGEPWGHLLRRSNSRFSSKQVLAKRPAQKQTGRNSHLPSGADSKGGAHDPRQGRLSCIPIEPTYVDFGSAPRLTHMSAETLGPIRNQAIEPVATAPLTAAIIQSNQDMPPIPLLGVGRGQPPQSLTGPLARSSC